MKSFKIVLLVLLTLPLFSFADPLKVRILDIHDGDTLTGVGVEDSKKYKIRLMGVDTPEIDFFKFSQNESAVQARDALRTMLPKNTVIELSDDSEIDKHGRVLGVILKDGVDINQEMLHEGWGFLYFIYPFEKRMVMNYSQAALEGITNKKGLFAESLRPTEEPYLFRMRVRKQVGRNPVGDLETKQLFEPKDIEQIPLWRRVFFSDLEAAKQMGYN